MAVARGSLIAIRNFNGYQEPGLPAGYWHFELSSLGDASGGLNSVLVRFQVAGSPSPSQLWSLEHLNVSSSGIGVGVLARLQITNMDLVPPMGSNGATAFTYTLTLIAGVFGVDMEYQNSPIQLFLGRAIDNNLNAGFQVDYDNVDATSLRIRAGGYFWPPGAATADGGPRRPLQGLYAR